ncbi:uncharacterized protein BP5553_06960 [Venustampulla echinocandica]|uniref:Uncharacterized protein n=1 Tax=Venustampulla echinocandica TaxID=2656787 RepID=A0A370TI52_9HELO|nr:uncharacterized protein BP5553_06960 [Venustampulla echinocandica]RDL35029.1 hypothetical protein BP5553_06960 [Venustampulla echinocandica]
MPLASWPAGPAGCWDGAAAQQRSSATVNVSANRYAHPPGWWPRASDWRSLIVAAAAATATEPETGACAVDMGVDVDEDVDVDVDDHDY